MAHLVRQLVARPVLGGSQDEPGHWPAVRCVVRLTVLQIDIICQVAAVYHAAHDVSLHWTEGLQKQTDATRIHL